MLRFYKNFSIIQKTLLPVTRLYIPSNPAVYNKACVVRLYSKHGSDSRKGSGKKPQVTRKPTSKLPRDIHPISSPCPPQSTPSCGKEHSYWCCRGLIRGSHHDQIDPYLCNRSLVCCQNLLVFLQKQLPYYQECPEPIKRPVPPECKYCPEEEEEKRRYRRNMLLAALFTAALIGGMFIYNKDRLKPKPKKKKKFRRPSVIIKNPENSSDIPNSVPYLLIGGGTASFSAFRAIKSADPTAKVLVLSSEGYYPYMRPPLSKEMWFTNDKKLLNSLMFKQWNGSERSLFYEPEDFYLKCTELMESQNGGVAVARGWPVQRIDVENRKVFLEDDYEIQYDKCLIATGALPRTLEVFESIKTSEPEVEDKITVYRNIYDFDDLLDTLEHARNIVIIGGGFLGSELACALAKKGGNQLQVTQVFRESGNMGKILPEYLSSWTTAKVRAEGVEVISNKEVIGVGYQKRQKKVCLTLSGGTELTADHVIVAVGAVPNTELAESAGLEVDPDLGGYLVNTELQARSNLYIAGDCSCFYDTKLGRRRVEHHDHAVVSGRLAGENMAGASKPYLHQSMFWSDLGPDVGYEAIGIIDSSLPTVGIFAKATEKDSPRAVVSATDEGIRSTTEEECKEYAKTPEGKELKKKIQDSSSGQAENDDFGKGVIFYLRDNIVIGIVMWNVFNRMSVARQVLKEARRYEDLNEVAKLFKIHEE